MATRSTAAKSSRKSRSGRSGSSGRRSGYSTNHNQGSLLLALWAGLTGLYGGRVILTVVFASLVIWIEALLFRQNYLSFFRLIGIEILFALFISWVFYLIHSTREVS